MTSFLIAVLALVAAQAEGAPKVTVIETPAEGIQPVAQVDPNGNVHLVYFKGDPAHGDLFHAVRPQGAEDFGEPTRINSTNGSAVALGTIRGPQLSLGSQGYVHVVWNGSSVAAGEDHHQTPMLYARSTDGGATFEDERNLITEAYGLDGGGAVAADGSGEVNAFWHAGPRDGGEGGRQIWVARSRDHGKTFAAEVPAWNEPTGVCACCGMTAAATEKGTFVLYRSATEGIHRDIYLLQAADGAGLFRGSAMDRWDIEACPMSAMALSSAGDRVAAAWEAKGGGVAFKFIGEAIEGQIPHGKHKRKFPDIAVAPDGHTLVAWIDGGGWKKKGRLAWQIFGPGGEPLGEPTTAGPSAEWTKPAVVFTESGFQIFH